MSISQQENYGHGSSRQRPRANTSFIAWRRNMPDPSTSTSLASSPAAPIQTLPIDTLIQFLTPPAVTSPQHARALVSALLTQTPAPSPSVLMPILSSICATNAPTSLQAAGFDVLAAYCSCGVPLMTSDRLIFFDILQSTVNATWSQEVWEPRLKALNALMSATEDAMGIEKQLLGLFCGWLKQAFEDCCTSDIDRQEWERSIETLSDALIEWFSRFEDAGRLAEGEILSLFEFYQSLVDYALRLPTELVQHSAPPTPTPPTPQRDNGNSTTSRHRRNPSSLASVPSPLSPLSPNVRTRSPPLRGPVQFVSTIYLTFLNSRLRRLPLSFLPSLMPLLFRILSAIMSPLPSLSPDTAKCDPVEHRVIKTITALLSGPYATTCLILLRQLLLPVPGGDTDTQVRTSLGALRTLRQQIRTVLEDRMAMRVVQRGASSSATPAGAPASVVGLDEYILERAQRAWTREGAAVWDARKVSLFLVKAIRAWNDSSIPPAKERIFEETAGLLKDVLQEMDDRLDDRDFLTDKDFSDTDTGGAIGRTLYELMTYVQGLRNEDGTSMILPLGNAFSAPTPFLRALAECFGHGQSLSYLDPPASIVLLSIVDHLLDIDSERIPLLMVQQHQLKPTSSEWLENWEQLLLSASLFMQTRPRTRHAAISALQSVFTLVRDMPGYRRPLMDSVFNFWAKMVSEKNEGSDGSAIWRLLGEEAVLRATEDDIEELFTPTDESAPDITSVTVHMILAALSAASTYCECDGEIEIGVKPAEVPPTSPMVHMTPSSTVFSSAGSPTLPRMAPDSHVHSKDKEPGSNMHQQLLSLLSFASPRHQSQNQVPQVLSPEDVVLSAGPRSDRSPLSRSSPELITVPIVCRGLITVTALCEVFLKLAFIDSVMTTRQSRLAIFVFGQLLRLLRTAHCPRVRITVLQMLMRLRADRDHRVYLARAPAEYEQQIVSLARFIHRFRDLSASSNASVDDTRAEEISLERARTASVLERDGRRASRGRGSRRSGTVSRSRSRATGRPTQPATSGNAKPRDQLWAEPDIVPFCLNNADKGSQMLVTYDPVGPNETVVLPVSDYMDELVEIIKTDRDWEVLSFVLVHLPAQLANKHFWCGPLARESIAKLLTELCQSIKGNTLGKYINQEEWPTLSKSRDVIGLAYHTLTVLISYNTVFDPARRKALVDVLQMGLSGQGDTVVVCTHALNLCAYEMETTMVKDLPSILEKLTQIVSNPLMAVHILTFLANLNTLPNIYSNFTDADFKLVFAVALQYLQHHNRLETSREMQFSLSQHVRIMSYYVLYMWFLSLKLVDRSRHVSFIVRQLLLANNNEDRNEIDVPTEVAFDLLARYTYANADPKPAPSLLGDILSNPSEGMADGSSVQEKSWIIGYSIVTVRRLAKTGWLEVTTRRPSGTTRFLCKSENVPLVDLGDINPDMLTIPASLMMDKDPHLLRSILTPDELADQPEIPPEKTDDDGDLVNDVFKSSSEGGENVPPPDPVMGYVWTGSAPSQRRKRVDLDPSFFPLQFSPYPDTKSTHRWGRIVRDTRALAATIRVLDRIPVIDTHKVGILYVGPGQTNEIDILRNTRGSPAYTRFLEGLARLIKVRGQLDVYTGGLDPDEDGEFAYAWWDDVGQILYHTATMMPNHDDDERCNLKKRHLGNDLVRIVWNDSGLPYRFDTLTTEFQFVNIVVEPHSRGAIAAYSDNKHENEYFRLSVQCADGMAKFAPMGDFKIVSARSLSILVRQLSLVADWYTSIFKDTVRDTERNEIVTNWRARLETIKKFAGSVPSPYNDAPVDQGVMGLQAFLDFTPEY